MKPWAIRLLVLILLIGGVAGYLYYNRVNDPLLKASNFMEELRPRINEALFQEDSEKAAQDVIAILDEIKDNPIVLRIVLSSEERERISGTETLYDLRMAFYGGPPTRYRVEIMPGVMYSTTSDNTLSTYRYVPEENIAKAIQQRLDQNWE
jgi:hypothetical protein